MGHGQLHVLGDGHLMENEVDRSYEYDDQQRRPNASKSLRVHRCQSVYGMVRRTSPDTYR